MVLSGFSDEASPDIDGQIDALLSLGWKNIEPRNISGANFTLLDDKDFEVVCEKLYKAGIAVHCFGSGIANWAKKITNPPESSYEELKRAIPRMHKLGTKFIRVMSFAIAQDATANDSSFKRETIKRMQWLTGMAEDGGVTLLHENCDGWGGLSWEHTLRMLESVNSENLKLVFDTGNPVAHKDIRGAEPFGNQDGWEYYSRVKDFVVHVHIKDGVMEREGMRYTFAGEGKGYVREICTDLLKRGYDGAFSIEPHMAVVVHDKRIQTEEKVRFDNFVEYGKRVERLLRGVGYEF